MVRQLVFALCLLLSFAASQNAIGQRSSIEKMSVQFLGDTAALSYIRDNRIYSEGWHGLPQVNFWKEVVNLSPDSGLISILSTRQIYAKIPTKIWNSLTDIQKDMYRDSVKKRLNVADTERVVFTIGKNDFYNFSHAIKIIGEAYKMFEDVGVPAFYAQSILLIECPGELKRSSAGAHGHFQLMPGVARNMGLIVNKQVDERKDFKKCAQAAAKFINNVCIPNAERILSERSISYNKNELWFKLLVLHVYHAGAGNVAAALDAISNRPSAGNIELITTLWQTKAGAFGNASQNYSQIALANTIILYDLLLDRCENISSIPYTIGS